MEPMKEHWTSRNVGIRGMEFYFPKLYVKLRELEVFDEVSRGKYTVGLGQSEMSFCADHEDITSICLTVVSKLLNNYDLSTKDIGFLCVGTETLIDKSKSVKTSLMRLFGENCDIEGIDVKNACYGGTQALFHAIDWIYANWEIEKRYAITVMADIALYDAGPARCTGGVGAFAALIGPNAIVSFDRGLRGVYMADIYDFYKPNQPVVSEYPIVEGQTSIQAYFTALHQTYELYCQKSNRLRHEGVDISKFDALFFHCPFTRLVKKAFGLLAFLDFKHGYNDHLLDIQELELEKFIFTPREMNYMNRDFVAATEKMSSVLYSKKTEPFLVLNRRLGNMYTASLYSQLIYYFYRSNSKDHIINQRLLFFSYGSGVAAATFSAHISMLQQDSEDQYIKIKKSVNQVISQLNRRICVEPKRYHEILRLREELTSATAPYKPEGAKNDLTNDFSLFPDTYYLENIGDKYKRFYAQSNGKTVH
ncbi:unnamed protein product [Thelazia callipaeda]|uniref:Hydroxymethylglutaryl-CoA synthase n=1 Tax=Thelazia callipaeda TaxID=103827 RepID=A0A0N5DAP3_THECL|nr:unnamed protein product [Thelazia callipaeda]